jgi:hypothetical protein
MDRAREVEGERERERGRGRERERERKIPKSQEGTDFKSPLFILK